jgi:beta-lactamase superfamily II metal-dependent hydrolase
LRAATIRFEGGFVRNDLAKVVEECHSRLGSKGASMIKSPFDDHVSVDETTLFLESTGSKKKGSLLWGDGVEKIGPTSNGRIKVRARGRENIGWVSKDDLGGSSLLEVYFIDVGQGDGVLIKTPDFKHIMIDGGHPRKSQMTGKSAADFVDWKFFEDYGLDGINLDAMIASHNDYDHYGGLADLLDAAQLPELDAKAVSVDAFYHAGISWWQDSEGNRTLGNVVENDGKSYYTQILENRAMARAAVDGETKPQLQGAWGDFIAKVVKARTSSNKLTPIQRISHLTGHLPGFEASESDPVVHVLGPVEFDVDGKSGLLKLGADSKTTNGNSVLLRLDYGRSRILLTGDLNKASQHALLGAYAGDRIAFQCDVAKACHHGSEDVSFAFLQAMNAAATVISSGDGEGHDHPRPRIVAASGASGYMTVVKDEIITPLVYSTELARSVSVADPVSLTIPDVGGGAPMTVPGGSLEKAEVEFKYRKPGGLQASKGKRTLGKGSIAAKLIYGLVNVRTDGQKILTATMNEGDGTFAVKTFESRF